MKKPGKVLCVSVGGGNDSVSALWLLGQMRADLDWRPDRVDILAMLPDVLEYRDVLKTSIDGIVGITQKTTRWVGNKRIKAFPEPLLAGYGGAFGVVNVWGAVLRNGSVGLAERLGELARHYDTIVALDVGGDFIACPENTKVLSPMMDGYALYALRQLERHREITYGVFGLGTDAESSPEMLKAALSRIRVTHEGGFDGKLLDEQTRFYEQMIMPNRYSGTGNRLREFLRGMPIDDREHLRKMHMHVQPRLGVVKKYETVVRYRLEPHYTGRYYLFENSDGIKNPFSVECGSANEWMCAAQKVNPRPCHELCGQMVEGAYAATPSWVFDEEARQAILTDAQEGLANGCYKKLIFNQVDAPKVELGGLE